jgi:hypothetical protein
MPAGFFDSDRPMADAAMSSPKRVMHLPDRSAKLGLTNRDQRVARA